jgi:hypothetical protein
LSKIRALERIYNYCSIHCFDSNFQFGRKVTKNF